MKALLLFVACAATWILASTAHADAPPRAAHLKDQPCAGCLASLPPGSDPAPLLVVLHGDGETASGLYDKWRHWTEPRGIALLSLACPASEGCRGSWWRWNGDPAWIDQQVTRLSEQHPIDRERLWLAGFSGGGSYAGYRTQEIERMFGAIVIHGGGIPPELPSCSALQASVYFLVGDGNPLHHLAVRLRDHYQSCKQDVQWTLLKGTDHAGEWSALDHWGGTILDWLEAHRRAIRLPEPARAAAASDPASGVSSDPLSSVSAPAPSKWACSIGGPAHASPHRLAALSILFVSLLVSRSLPRQRQRARHRRGHYL